MAFYFNMIPTTLTSLAEFEQLKQTQSAFVLYITDGTCNVGENVGPKLEKLVAEQFPKMELHYVYTSLTPEIAAQLSVFVIPTVLVFFDGKLTIQKSRTFSLEQLESEIERYYNMLF
ncbi:MAG: thioredoxin family protein [Flavobacteriaceae bacterium]